MPFIKEEDIGEPLKEVKISPAPAIVDQKEYDKMSTHINHLLSHIPHDLLRFDCAEMEQPLMELLYETDEWAKQTPIGKQEWVTPQIPSGRELDVEMFLKEQQETGDRATYAHCRLVRSISEAYEQVQMELELNGPRFTKKRGCGQSSSFGRAREEEGEG